MTGKRAVRVECSVTVTCTRNNLRVRTETIRIQRWVRWRKYTIRRPRKQSTSKHRACERVSQRVSSYHAYPRTSRGSGVPDGNVPRRTSKVDGQLPKRGNRWTSLGGFIYKRYRQLVLHSFNSQVARLDWELSVQRASWSILQGDSRAI
jgi:hypothetical protein